LDRSLTLAALISGRVIRQGSHATKGVTRLIGGAFTSTESPREHGRGLPHTEFEVPGGLQAQRDHAESREHRLDAAPL
jgi:hypothetical protein